MRAEIHESTNSTLNFYDQNVVTRKLHLADVSDIEPRLKKDVTHTDDPRWMRMLSRTSGDGQVQATPNELQMAKSLAQKVESRLIPEGDRAILKDIRESILDGDVLRLNTTLQGMQDKPEKLSLFCDEINRQFAGTGTKLSVQNDGTVLLRHKPGEHRQFSKDGTAKIDQEPDTAIQFIGSEILLVKWPIQGSEPIKPLLDENAESGSVESLMEKISNKTIGFLLDDYLFPAAVTQRKREILQRQHPMMDSGELNLFTIDK